MQAGNDCICPGKQFQTLALVSVVALLASSLLVAQAKAQTTTFNWGQAAAGQQVPSARSGHGMVYDLYRQKVIIFGGTDQNGNFLNDMWQWNSTTRSWSLVTSATASVPLPRANFAMAYDAGRSKIVLYGGNVSTAYSNVGITGDTWEFDSATLTWSQIPQASTLAYVGLWGAQAAYDPNFKQVILFGGQPYWGFPQNGNTYAWTGADWKIVASTTAPTYACCYSQTSPWGPGPAGRVSAMMATDTIRSTVVLFGGHTVSPTSSYDIMQNDTWVWNGISWSQVALSGMAPAARVAGGFAYDNLLGVSILFGGNSVSGLVADTWEWNGANWEALTPITIPSVRSTPMTYDPAGNDFLILGGSSPTVPSSDTWVGSLIPGDNDSQLANLAGGNTFSGNQTINGTLTASSFAGDGSGLTGVNASTAATAFGLSCTGCVGNAQLAINYAGGDAQGGNALNALLLGGNPASAFAPASGSPNYAPASGSPNYAPATGSSAYVAKAGDTMTGILNLPANGLVAGANQFALAGGNVGIGTVTPKAALHVWSNGTAGTFPISIEAGGWGVIGFNSTWIPNAGARQYNVNGYSGSIALSANDGSFRFATAPQGAAGSNALENTTLVLTNSGNLGVGTLNPAATLEVNGTAKFDNTVTFAAGQTFPGAGTISGITAGAGLSGGGTSGNVSLNIPAAGVTNTMLANPSLTVAAGAGLTGGGSVSLGGTTSVSLAPQSCAVGSAVTAHPFTCSPFAGLGANTFTGAQTMPNLTVPGSATFGTLGYNGYTLLAYNNSLAAVAGNSNNGSGLYGTSGSNVAVLGTNGGNTGGGSTFTSVGGQIGVEGTSTSPVGYGVYGLGTSAVGVYGVTSGATSTVAAGVFNNSGTTNAGNILLGQYNGTNEFIVDAKGDVTANGNMSTAGSVTIGTGGTPIVEYVSTTYNAVLPALTSGSCTTFTTAALTGFTPGSSDTIALGLPKALASSLGGNVFLIYQAWETTTTTSPTITIQVCNPTGSRYAGGATGTIRIDIFKH